MTDHLTQDGPALDLLDYANLTDENLQELANVAAMQYATFIVELQQCTSMGAVHELTEANPSCVLLNDHIQFLIAMAKKGLVDIHATDYVLSNLHHPVAQYISAAAVSKQLANIQSYTSMAGTARGKLMLFATNTILGGITTWISSPAFANINPSLIPNIAGTIH